MRKKSFAAPPEELYAPSTLYQKAKAYVENVHDGWHILSAKHHVLDPDGPPIEPYDETLTTASADERRAWSRTVREHLADRGLLTKDTTLVFHTGKAYYGELLPLLAATPVDVEIPTEGLISGEKLAWYNDRI